MNGPRNRLRRGQPLIALCLLLTAWVGARAVLYEEAATPPPAALADKAELAPPPAPRPVAPAGAAVAEQPVVRPAPAPQRPFVAAPAPAPEFDRVRLAEGHQLLWQAAVAPPPDPATAPAPIAQEAPPPSE